MGLISKCHYDLCYANVHSDLREELANGWVYSTRTFRLALVRPININGPFSWIPNVQTFRICSLNLLCIPPCPYLDQAFRKDPWEKKLDLCFKVSQVYWIFIMTPLDLLRKKTSCNWYTWYTLWHKLSKKIDKSPSTLQKLYAWVAHSFNAQLMKWLSVS